MDQPGKRLPSELLTPTLQGVEGSQTLPKRRPFRLQSQVWLGVLGGVLPMLVIGLENARRLDVSPELRRRMLYLGLAATAVCIGIYAWVLHGLDVQVLASEGRRSIPRWPRFANQVLGGLLYLAYERIQRTADRRFQFVGGEHASLWGPGIAVLLGCTAIQLAAIYAAVSLLSP